MGGLLAALVERELLLAAVYHRARGYSDVERDEREVVVAEKRTSSTNGHVRPPAIAMWS